jgi:hypothetical protein
MALSKLEKAMALWIGIEVLKPGTLQPITRKALEAAFVATVRGGQALGRAALPVAARGAVPTARALANPYVGIPVGLAAATYGTQRYLDETGLQEEINVARDQTAQAVLEQLDIVRAEGKKLRKKPKTAFNRAVSKAMKAVKASKFQGKQGMLKNPKKTFAMVSKTVSKVSKGGKVASKGVSGVIKRAAAKINFPTKSKRGSRSIRGTMKRIVRGYK